MLLLKNMGKSDEFQEWYDPVLHAPTAKAAGTAKRAYDHYLAQGATKSMASLAAYFNNMVLEIEKTAASGNAKEVYHILLRHSTDADEGKAFDKLHKASHENYDARAESSSRGLREALYTMAKEIGGLSIASEGFLKGYYGDNITLPQNGEEKIIENTKIGRDNDGQLYRYVRDMATYGWKKQYYADPQTTLEILKEYREKVFPEWKALLEEFENKSLETIKLQPQKARDDALEPHLANIRDLPDTQGKPGMGKIISRVLTPAQDTQEEKKSMSIPEIKPGVPDPRYRPDGTVHEDLLQQWIQERPLTALSIEVSKAAAKLGTNITNPTLSTGTQPGKIPGLRQSSEPTV